MGRMDVFWRALVFGLVAFLTSSGISYVIEGSVDRVIAVGTAVGVAFGCLAIRPRSRPSNTE